MIRWGFRYKKLVIDLDLKEWLTWGCSYSSYWRWFLLGPLAIGWCSYKLGRCFYCGKDSGNFPIWIAPHVWDEPPTCYCPRIDEDGKLLETSPCDDHLCISSVTMYPCQHCGR